MNNTFLFLNNILFLVRSFISYSCVGVIFLFILIKKFFPPLKSFKKIIIIFIIFIITQALLISFLNYYTWGKDELAKKLLPPYTPISYFLHYSWLHYFLNPFLSILVAILVFYGISFLNRKFNNVLFYDEEPYLASLGILVTNWPNCLIYLCLVLFLGVISHLFIYFFNVLIQKGVRNTFRTSFRLSLLYFWLPCALLVLFLGGIISKYFMV